MLGQSRKDLICLFVAIILVTASMIYWSAFSIKLYHTFHLSWDVANSAYDMYYHIHHLSQLHGLQYLSFADHLAPDQLIILPVFYLFPSALTLLLVQVAVVSLTGLLVFFITKRLTKSSFFGLLLCFAFLINPGTTGIIISDYHAEFLIIPFMLLTFYFFTERKRLPFFASLLLLLGTIESASFLGLALGAGLLFFEFRYDTNEKRGMRKEKIKLAISIILLSLLAIAAYAYSGASLSSSYANGSYSGLPPTLHVINFAAKESTGLFSIGAGAGLQGFILLRMSYMHSQWYFLALGSARFSFQKFPALRIALACRKPDLWEDKLPACRIPIFQLYAWWCYYLGLPSRVGDKGRISKVSNSIEIPFWKRSDVYCSQKYFLLMPGSTSSLSAISRIKLSRKSNPPLSASYSARSSETGSPTFLDDSCHTIKFHCCCSTRCTIPSCGKGGTLPNHGACNRGKRTVVFAPVCTG